MSPEKLIGIQDGFLYSSEFYIQISVYWDSDIYVEEKVIVRRM